MLRVAPCITLAVVLLFVPVASLLAGLITEVPKGIWSTEGALISAVMVFLFTEEKNPLRWWRFFAGIDVYVAERNGHDSFRFNLGQDDSVIETWCKRGKMTFVRVNDMRYRFLYKSDATLFKLTWS